MEESARSERSENLVDEFVDVTGSPHEPTSDAELDRLRKSAFFVHGNYFRIAKLGPNVLDDGMVRFEETGGDDGYSEYQKKAEILRRVHNYVSSLYSYNLQVLDHVNEKTHDRTYDKGDLLPGPNASSRELIEYVQSYAFLHGLRNDIQHGEYHCLSVDKVDENEENEYYQVRFSERRVEPKPAGGLERAGDYLRHSERAERRYLLTYICEFHDLFNEFETDLEAWCERSRTSTC